MGTKLTITSSLAEKEGQTPAAGATKVEWKITFPSGETETKAELFNETGLGLRAGETPQERLELPFDFAEAGTYKITDVVYTDNLAQGPTEAKEADIVKALVLPYSA